MIPEKVRLHWTENPYSSEAVAVFEETWRHLLADPDAARLWTERIDAYRQTPVTEDVPTLADTLAQKTGLPLFSVHQVVFYSLIPALFAHYATRGLPEALCRETLRDLFFKWQECLLVEKQHGTFVSYWYRGFFDLTRFSFGKLQGEIRPFREKSFVQGKRRLQEGDPVINLHIPRTGEPLTPADCDEALKRAAAFFQGEFTASPCAFVCNSWLLASEVEHLLSPKSNVAAFRSRFTVLAEKRFPVGEYPDLWRLFDTRETELARLPEHSSLHTRYKTYLLQGGTMGRAYGAFFYPEQAN